MLHQTWDDDGDVKMTKKKWTDKRIANDGSINDVNSSIWKSFLYCKVSNWIEFIYKLVVFVVELIKRIFQSRAPKSSQRLNFSEFKVKSIQDLG